MSSKKLNKNKNYFFRKFFYKKEGKQILKKLKKNLIKEGYLDSMDVVSLASLIQKHFKIKINLSKESVLKSFENFNSIIKLIK